MTQATIFIEAPIIKKFQDAVINWYSTRGRRFPWRETTDPYKILISEFMLQKTDADKVLGVYGNFLRRWPDVNTLAEAELTALREMFKPLGLYYRADRLKKTAKAICDQFGGKVPETEDELLNLPGAGRYIAFGVMCFAYNKPKAVMDTTVIRLFGLVFNIKSTKPRPRDDAELWDKVQEFVSLKNPKEYNWGLLDYGCLVCKSRKPLCEECILKEICQCYKEIEKKEWPGRQLKF